MAHRRVPDPLSLKVAFSLLQGVILACLCSLAAAQPAPLADQPIADPPANTGSPLLDLFQIFILILVVGVIGYSVWFAREKLGAIRQKEALDEATLAAELSRLENDAGINNRSEITMLNASVLQALDDLEDEVDEDGVSPLPQYPGVGSAPLPVSTNAPSRCDLVIDRLRAGGLVEDVEGYRELNGDPNASAVVKLRSGKRALVVGYFESEIFLHRNLMRYDMVIVQGDDGKTLVVNKFENVISEWLAGKFL